MAKHLQAGDRQCVECSSAAPVCSSNAALNFDYCRQCKRVTHFRKTRVAPPSAGGAQHQKYGQDVITPLYRNVHQHASMQRLLAQPHCAQDWVDAFFWFTSQRPVRNTREMRVFIKLQTQTVCRNGWYYAHAGPIPRHGAALAAADTDSVPADTDAKVVLDAQLIEHSALGTQMYEEKELANWLPSPESVKPVSGTGGGALGAVKVVNQDCLDAARDLVRRGYAPVVLNMASSSTPGGGWEYGAGAQEENLHRRSTYWLALSDPLEICRKRMQRRHWGYPIPEFGSVYSPQVQVFRSNEASGYDFLAQPDVFTTAFVAVAAYRHPPMQDKRLVPQYAKNTLRKLRVLLATCAKHGHKALVLSALGCGAYRNPPGHVAELMKQALLEFAGTFEVVLIAIIEDHNSRGGGNLAPFKRTFSS